MCLKTEEIGIFKAVFTGNSIVGLIYEIIFRGEVLCLIVTPERSAVTEIKVVGILYTEPKLEHSGTSYFL